MITDDYTQDSGRDSQLMTKKSIVQKSEHYLYLLIVFGNEMNKRVLDKTRYYNLTMSIFFTEPNKWLIIQA